MRSFFLRALIGAVFLLAPALPAHGQDVGDAAPDFTYMTLEGGEWSLSDHSGKVVFIFVFGSTCPICLSVGNRTETEVNAVFGTNPNFQAVGVDDWDGSASAVEAFKQQTGVTYPLCLLASSISTTYKTTYDRIIVIDQEGIIRFKENTKGVDASLDDAIVVIEDLLDGTTTDVEDEGLPSRHALHQNYPNPFNPTTTLSYTLPASAHVTLRVYDLYGREVRTLVDGVEAAGLKAATWDGTDAAGNPVASGVYFYTLKTPSFSQSRAMTLLK